MVEVSFEQNPEQIGNISPEPRRESFKKRITAFAIAGGLALSLVACEHSEESVETTEVPMEITQGARALLTPEEQEQATNIAVDEILTLVRAGGELKINDAPNSDILGSLYVDGKNIYSTENGTEYTVSRSNTLYIEHRSDSNGKFKTEVSFWTKSTCQEVEDGEAIDGYCPYNKDVIKTFIFKTNNGVNPPLSPNTTVDELRELLIRPNTSLTGLSIENFDPYYTKTEYQITDDGALIVDGVRAGNAKEAFEDGLNGFGDLTG